MLKWKSSKIFLCDKLNFNKCLFNYFNQYLLSTFSVTVTLIGNGEKEWINWQNSCLY